MTEDPVLVTGAGGLLGREVARALALAGTECLSLAHADLDVADGPSVRDAVTRLRPRAVVHCAALTDVDRCQTEPELGWAVNAQGPRHVAEAAAAVGAEVVAISTDYVFDGEKGSPYTELDEPHPIQEYGRTKLQGERNVQETNPRHYVLRSAWIHGVGGKNFLSRLFGLVREHGRIRAVVDQIGSPTYAPDLAGAIVGLLGSDAFGTFHVINEGACSFAEFCRHALGLAGLDAEIEEVSCRDLGRPAARPANTSLEGLLWRREGFEPLRPWREAAKEFVEAAR